MGFDCDESKESIHWILQRDLVHILDLAYVVTPCLSTGWNYTIQTIH